MRRGLSLQSQARMSSFKPPMTHLKKIFAPLFAAGCFVLGANPAHASCGEASFYGPGLYGGVTANGEILRPGTMIAAHPYYPLGSWIRVTNQRNGRSVQLKVVDRGPYVSGRIVDVSEAAAHKLGMIASGIASVCISRL